MGNVSVFLPVFACMMDFSQSAGIFTLALALPAAVPHSLEDTANHFGFTLGYARTFEEEAVDNALLELPWWYEEADWFPIRFIPE